MELQPPIHQKLSEAHHFAQIPLRERFAAIKPNINKDYLKISEGDPKLLMWLMLSTTIRPNAPEDQEMMGLLSRTLEDKFRRSYGKGPYELPSLAFSWRTNRVLNQVVSTPFYFPTISFNETDWKKLKLPEAHGVTNFLSLENTYFAERYLGDEPIRDVGIGVFAPNRSIDTEDHEGGHIGDPLILERSPGRFNDIERTALNETIAFYMQSSIDLEGNDKIIFFSPTLIEQYIRNSVNFNSQQTFTQDFFTLTGLNSEGFGISELSDGLARLMSSLKTYLKWMPNTDLV